MDMLKIQLSTKWMRGIIAKLIKKVISKQLGYDVDILLNEISVEAVGGKIHIHANVDAEVDNDTFQKIIGLATE